METAEQKVRSLIKRNGAISFSDFMEIALYEPGAGFYDSGGAAGRRGDFITSPEVGPLFGVLMARWIDQCWEQLDKPDPFFVFDVGAGPGTLAKSVLRAEPNCSSSMRYVLVERSATQRELHNEHLELEDHNEVFGGEGPIVVSVAEVPAVRVDGVVVANELFDNVPFDIAEFHKGRWCEVLVTESDGKFSWAPGAEIENDLLPTEAKEGARAPLLNNAANQLQNFFDLLETGFVLALDYGVAETSELVKRSPDWLRTFREHEKGNDPFEDVGQRDITTDVAFDQLARVAKPNSLVKQSEFLEGLGIAELVEDGKRVWKERAALGDLQALEARSRVNEAEALLDPKSLGAFTVVQWKV